MSRLGKLCLILSLLSLFIFAVVGYLSMFLTAKHYIPLYLSILGVLGSVVLDFGFYKKFFVLKTTKHGISIGVYILLFFVLLISLNFIVFKNNKTWDLTQEKLHSLSDQTLEVLKTLDEPVKIKCFLIKGRPNHDNIRNAFESKIRLYKQAGDIDVSYINPHIEPALSKEYDVDESGAIVVEYKDKKTEIDLMASSRMMPNSSMSEQDITNAIIKVTRDKDKTLYFLTNHGEVDLLSDTARGGLTLKRELEALSYQVKVLSFIETGGSLPEDADAVFVLGPTQPLLEREVQALTDYIKSGGSLLLAIDPGTNHGTDEILNTLGIEFKNEYVIDRMAALLGDVPVTALGVRYSEGPITKKLTPGAASLFYMVSGFDVKEGTGLSFEYDQVVQTDASTVSTSKLEKEVSLTGRGPFSVVYSVSGSFSESTDEQQDDSENTEDKTKFFTVLYGDSDIFTNARIFQQLNRDLVLNTVSALLKDEDLINIRPKTPAQTVMAAFTSTKYKLFNIIPFSLFPLILIISGIVLSYRRKGL